MLHMQSRIHDLYSSLPCLSEASISEVRVSRAFSDECRFDVLKRRDAEMLVSSCKQGLNGLLDVSSYAPRDPC